MSIIEESPLSVGTSGIPAHGINTQGNTIRYMGPAALGVETTRGSLSIVTSRAIRDVIKPAIKAFLETCDTNPPSRITV